MDRGSQGIEDEDMVPDEFSDDMDEYMENEEQFSARQSISSRGSIGRATKNRKENISRVTNANKVSQPPYKRYTIYIF